MSKKEKDPRVGIVGGQAVLEGVMMKSGDRCSLAVRTEDGIVIDNTTETSLRKKYKILGLPIIRGCVSFVEQLFSAMKMLTKSADMQGIDLDEPETKFEKWLTEKLGDKLMAVVGGIGMILGVILAVGLFMLMPTYAAKGIDWLAGGFVSKYSILFSLIEGLIRIAIFVAYVWLVSFMPDIRRTYEYHGAEHKSVDCFEKGLPLTPENAKTCTRFHPRCGTSFIFVVLIISIIVNSFLEIDNTVIRFASKLLTLPIIVGVGFEFIKYAGGHNNILTKILSAPGLWMQRITTREPDEAQLEVALTALRNAIPDEFGGVNEQNYDPETKKMIKKDQPEEKEPTEDAE
ncbi:MAG: DUF1385 domain-containing protein [Clostridia bacterium]|nr:DUF1385 domain-containing protein [Clostridia bacterium]